MVNFSYSTDALNVISDFHETDYVVYVEGQDDIVFWQDVFRNASIQKAEIKEVGGDYEIKKKIDQIINEDAQIIVACDLDHRPFLKKGNTHPRVVNTFGYSIENTLYCPCNINTLTQKYSRSNTNYKNEIEQWLTTFTRDSIDLLVFDIANVRYKKGISVFGDCCSRYLTSKKSITIDISKVKEYIDKNKNKFKSNEVRFVRNAIKRDRRPQYLMFKGHFLTNGVLNYIKKKCKKIRDVNLSISLENLFVGLTGQCFNCTHECMDKQHLLSGAETAINNLN